MYLSLVENKKPGCGEEMFSGLIVCALCVLSGKFHRGDKCRGIKTEEAWHLQGRCAPGGLASTGSCAPKGVASIKQLYNKDLESTGERYTESLVSTKKTHTEETTFS